MELEKKKDRRTKIEIILITRLYIQKEISNVKEVKKI